MYSSTYIIRKIIGGWRGSAILGLRKAEKKGKGEIDEVRRGSILVPHFI